MQKHFLGSLLVGALFLSSLLLVFPAYGAEIELECKNTDFARDPGDGTRSAYKDTAKLDRRILNWLVSEKKRQNTQTVRVGFCQIVQPYPERNSTPDGYRTVTMYDEFFDEVKNEFVRHGMKFVYFEKQVQRDGRLVPVRTVEAFADCSSIEACVRMGIYARAPMPARAADGRTNLQPLPGPAPEEDKDSLRRPLVPVPSRVPTLAAPVGGNR